MSKTAAEIAALIRAHKFSYHDEDALQAGIAAMLAKAGVAARREVRLKHGRIDLLAGKVGIETKVAGSPSDTAFQCGRYLADDQLDGLVLVTNRVRHLYIPDSMHGKPLIVVTLVGHGL